MAKVLIDIPATIPTGNAHHRIVNPILMRPTAINYEGLIAGYDFKFQANNYKLITERLKWVGLELQHIYSSIFKPSPYSKHNKNYQGMRHSFVALGEGFVWQKYASDCAQAGQNHVYARGEKWKTTDFCSLDYDQIRVLFSPTHVLQPGYSRSPSQSIDLDEDDHITMEEIKAI